MSARWDQIVAGQARSRPDAPALRDASGAAWSYHALDAAIDGLAARLTAEGVAPGDRVMVLSENANATVAAFFAAARCGAWAVPVNARLTAVEIDRILEHARPTACLATVAVSADARAHADRLGATDITGPFGTLALARPYPSAPADDADVAVLLYTTGTTGQPKGVMLTHGNLVYAGREAVVFRDLRPTSRVYGVAPMSHVIGLASMMTSTMTAGAELWLETRFDVHRLHAALQAGVTHLPGVPQMHALLMSHVREQGLERLDSPDLAYVSSGGAPLDPAWKRQAEAFYGLALQNGYGMTETSAAASITRNVLGDPDVSVGPPLPGVEIRIDEDVPGGGDGSGEVVIRGPNVMKGYYHNPQATAAALSPEGWLRSGDLGRIDESGRLHILGRLKELIIHGGFNVYPPEVEAALTEHPDVIQAAVVGRVVAGDEKVVAFVQVAEGTKLAEADLRAFAAERLAGYKRPAQIVVANSLPTAPTGKILKHALLDHFADRLR